MYFHNIYQQSVECLSAQAIFQGFWKIKSHVCTSMWNCATFYAESRTIVYVQQCGDRNEKGRIKTGKNTIPRRKRLQIHVTSWEFGAKNTLEVTCWGPSPLTMAGGGGEARIGSSGLRCWLDSRGGVWSAMFPSFTPPKRNSYNNDTASIRLQNKYILILRQQDRNLLNRAKVCSQHF